MPRRIDHLSQRLVMPVAEGLPLSDHDPVSYQPTLVADSNRIAASQLAEQLSRCGFQADGATTPHRYANRRIAGPYDWCMCGMALRAGDHCIWNRRRHPCGWGPGSPGVYVQLWCRPSEKRKGTLIVVFSWFVRRARYSIPWP